MEFNLKFIYKLPEELWCNILDFCDVVNIFDINDDKSKNNVLYKYIKFRYSNIFDKVYLKKNIPLKIANYVVKNYPSKMNIINIFYKKIKNNIVKNEYYDLFIYYIKSLIDSGIDVKKIKYIGNNNENKLMKYFIKKDDSSDLLFSIKILKYFNYNDVIIESCKLQNYNLLVYFLDNYKDDINDYNKFMNKIILDICDSDNVVFFDFFVKTYFLPSSNTFNLDSILCVSHKVVHKLILCCSYNILIYVIDELGFSTYPKICYKIYDMIDHFNCDIKYINLLHKILENNSEKVDDDVIENLIDKFAKLVFGCEYEFNEKHNFIFGDIKKNNAKYNLLKYLINHSKNNNRCINDTYYNNLFKYFILATALCYSMNKNRDINKVIDKNYILEVFIGKIIEIDNINISITNNSIKNIKNLFINNENNKFCMYENYDNDIKEVRLVLLDFLYFKYKNYFDESNFFVIDMINNKQYYIIKRLVKNGYILNGDTYKYILSQTNADEIIVNLYKEDIDFTKNGLDIVFCKYFATINNSSKIKNLCEIGFNVSEDIMNIALYNMSYNVVTYLYFDKNIKINDKGIDILYYHLESNNIAQINFAKYIEKNFFIKK